LPTNKFVFGGFVLPSKTRREENLQKFLLIPETIVFYESVHRLKETLLILKNVAPKRKFCLAREISKMHETFYRGLLQDIDLKAITYRGEFVFVIEGNPILAKTITAETFFHKIKDLNLTNKQILFLGKIFFRLKKHDLFKFLTYS